MRHVLAFLLVLVLPGCQAVRVPAAPPLSREAALAVLQVAKVHHAGPEGSWWGSAFPVRSWLQDGGWVVAYATAGHVVWQGRVPEPSAELHAAHFRILHPDGAVSRVLLVEAHPSLDAALLVVHLPGPVPVIPLDTRTPVPGEWVLTAGYAWGRSLTIAVGPVRHDLTASDQRPRPYWPTFSAGLETSPGTSGGAVVAADGRALGIHVGGRRGESLFVPLSVLTDWLAAALGE